MGPETNQRVRMRESCPKAKSPMIIAGLTDACKCNKLILLTPCSCQLRGLGKSWKEERHGDLVSLNLR